MNNEFDNYWMRIAFSIANKSMGRTNENPPVGCVIVSKENKLKSLGICDTVNLCGALEFSEKLSKIGTQPIIGTQIYFKYANTLGLLPLFALNEEGYKNIIELSSLSYLNNINYNAKS